MGSIFAGYAHVWRSRMSLLGVVALVFAPGLCADFLIGLAFAGSEAPIVNGVHLVFNTGFPVFLKLAVLLFFWLWAVSAGVTVVIGRPHVAAHRHTGSDLLATKPVLPEDQARSVASGGAAGIEAEPGLGRMLALTAAHAFLLSLAFALLFAVAFWALITIGPAGPIAVAVIMAGLAAALGSMLFLIPTRLLRQNLPATIRDRWWRMCGAALLGVVILPWLALAALQAAVSSIAAPLLAGTIFAAGMVVAVAGQAGALATIYLKARQVIEVEGQRPQHSAVGLLAGLVLLPGLVMAGAAAINPYGVPAVSEATLDAVGQVSAVGWPEGQNPIIATADGFLDCRNETCSEHVRHSFAPVSGEVIPAHSLQEITTDGTILSVDASVAGRLVLQRCARSGACSRSEIKGIFGYPELAVTATADGATYIAVVDSKSSEKKTKIDVIRCDESTCDEPLVMPLGEVDGELYAVPPIRIAVDAQKRPSVAILAGFRGIGTKLMRCADPACASVTDVRRPDGNFVLATTVFETLHPGARVGQGMIDEANWTLLRCGGYCELDLMARWASRGTGEGALGFGSAGMFSVTAEHPVQTGFRFTVGIGPALSQSRYTLWRCGDPQCQDMKSMLLNAGPRAAGLWLATRSDGSVFVVEDSGQLRTVVVPGR